MSIQNLINSDINSVDIECTASGAITGTARINFKRLDNIVYLSLSPLLATASAAPSIVLTPNTTIPSIYYPLQGISKFVTVSNGSISVLGLMLCPSNLSTLTFILNAGGNYSGTSGIVDNTILWKVNNV